MRVSLCQSGDSEVQALRNRLGEAVAARDGAQIERDRAEDRCRGLQRDLAAALASQEGAQADLGRTVTESRALQGELAEERERFIAERRAWGGVRDVLRADVARLQRRLAATEGAATSTSVAQEAVAPSTRAATWVSRQGEDGECRDRQTRADHFERRPLPTEQLCKAVESEVRRFQLAGEEAKMTGIPASVSPSKENSAMDPQIRNRSLDADCASGVPLPLASNERVDPLDDTGRLDTRRAAVIMSLISACSPQPRFTSFGCPKRW